MELQASVVREAIIYSCIAFSIVFIVLGGLTLMIFAMRIVTGSAASKEPPSSVVGAAQPKQSTDLKAQTDLKARHVAAITAAILASTQGKVRIVNITPAPQQQRTLSSETTQIWRTVAVVEASTRRFVPSRFVPFWKQQASY
jgi:Na+-transporting methylmalonyl-CoA/oxaloacetate decarboxylase gamma subunit